MSRGTTLSVDNYHVDADQIVVDALDDVMRGAALSKNGAVIDGGTDYVAATTAMRKSTSLDDVVRAVEVSLERLNAMVAS